MSEIIKIEDAKIPTTYACWSERSKFKSRGEKCTFEGREYTVVAKKADYRANNGFLKTCLAVAAIFFTCGFILFVPKFTKWLQKGHTVRFAIPTQKIDELQQKPAKDGDIKTKISELTTFYYPHFVATKNTKAIVTVIDNCLEAATTFESLNEVESAMYSRSIDGDREKRKETIKQKLIQFGAKEGPLWQVDGMLSRWQITDDGLDRTVAERLLTEEKSTSGRMWSNSVDNIRRYGKLLTTAFEFADKSKKYSASVLANLISHSGYRYHSHDRDDEVATKAVKLIFQHCAVTDSARKTASYYAIKHVNFFEPADIQTAVKEIITDKSSSSSHSEALSYCLHYIGANKAAFSSEIKVEAAARYQSIRYSQNNNPVLEDLMKELLKP